MGRTVVSSYFIAMAEQDIRAKLEKRLVQKGDKSYASNHESLGILTEEFHELTEAVQANDNKEVREELIDIVVGALFAIASMDAKKAKKNRQ